MKQEKCGVLLVNLGTPEAPTTKAVKRYLSSFLSDRRVIDLPRILWQPLLHGIILPRRAKRVAKLYRSIWMEEGSPLLVHSRRQQAALQARLPQIPIELAMSYGYPSLGAAMTRLNDQEVERLILLPLYPQYSCSTSGAVFDGVAQQFARYRRLPSLSYLRDYAEHPAYIAALCHRIRTSFIQQGEPEVLLFSYHGIPLRYVEEGDDYPQRCQATTNGVVAALSLDATQYIMTYQSRFGREPWLTPYTDETIVQLAEQGIEHLQVICPGFAADCLETLEEIQVQNRALFLASGGKRLTYIAALNDDALHIELLYQLVKDYLP